MSQQIHDAATGYSLAVKVANGGYIVHALPWDSEAKDFDSQTAVFTDIPTMLAYIERVCRTHEGPDEWRKTFGPLRVDDNHA